MKSGRKVDIEEDDAKAIVCSFQYIAAMAENPVIGRENKLPWDLPSEHRLFKEITVRHPIIFGRKTIESIGHLFPGRKNIVITTQEGFSPEGWSEVNDLQAAIAASKGSDEVFICGGEMVFREAMPLADRTYLTIIDEEFDGDAFFPRISDDFMEGERKKYEDILPYSMVRYERKAHNRLLKAGGLSFSNRLFNLPFQKNCTMVKILN